MHQKDCQGTILSDTLSDFLYFTLLEVAFSLGPVE